MPFILTENRIAYVQEGQLLAEATFPEFAPGAARAGCCRTDDGTHRPLFARNGPQSHPHLQLCKKMVRPASGICRRASLNAHTQNAPSLKRTSALGKARFLFYFSGSRFRAARISRSSKEAMLSE